MTSLALEFDPYEFACDGSCFGIPHFWNVVTNLPYLLVGAWGLGILWRRRLWGHPSFHDWTDFWIWTALVCVGSGAYHWVLQPWGLALDRIAICGVIASLAAHVAQVGLGLRPSRRRSLVFLVVAQATVLIWALGGTAWAYGVLQLLGGLAVLAVVLCAWRRGRLPTSPAPILLFLGAYALAKVVELLDRPICELSGRLGGHPLKHLVSAAGLACLVAMMRAEAEAAGHGGRDSR